MFGGGFFATNTKNTGKELTGLSGALQRIGGLTFFKKYIVGGGADADFSVGSPTATFTANRDATTPATYVDGSGVIQLVTTANQPRYQGGYYDATGFHSQVGLMIEGAGTNVGLNTLFQADSNSDGLPDGWTRQSLNSADFPTTQTLSDGLATFNVGATVNIQRLAGTEGTAAGTGQLNYYHTTKISGFVQNDVCTISAYLKGTTTGCDVRLVLFEYNSSDVFLSSQNSGYLTLPATSFGRFTATFTIAGATAAKISYGIQILNLGVGNSYDLQWACPQAEESSYATSFIPTTTAALTRNAEVLKYTIAGNRTANKESIFQKFVPEANIVTTASGTRTLMATDTKDRVIRNSSVGNYMVFLPNITDSGTTSAPTSTQPISNTSYVFAGIAYGTLAGTNVEAYVNSVSEGTDADNYTANAWGTFFYIGSSNTGTQQLDGIIQSVAIFNRALSGGEVATVTNLINGSSA